MIRCPNCLKENEDHYKFCLACGSELVAPDGPAEPKPRLRPSPTARVTDQDDDKLAFARTADRKSLGTEEEVGTASNEALAVEEAPPAAMPIPPVEPPTEVSDEQALPFEEVDEEAETAAAEEAPVGTVFEEGAEEDEYIEHTYMGVGPKREAAKAADQEMVNCPGCGIEVQEGYVFCGNCGARVMDDAEDQIETTPPQADFRVRLVVIRPDGSPGEEVPVTGDELIVGRSSSTQVFAEDLFLSPIHSRIFFEDDRLYITDEGSVNGTYVRLKGEVEIRHGDLFRIGQELLRFEEIDKLPVAVKPGEIDEITQGSPRGKDVWGRLCQIVAPDCATRAYLLEQPEVTIGRENGQILFPDDGFVSGMHARLVHKGKRYYLQDLGSSNGTYYNVRKKTELRAGDFILLGQQLFMIDF